MGVGGAVVDDVDNVDPVDPVDPVGGTISGLGGVLNQRIKAL